MKELPFSIDRSSCIKLPYQVADGLRSAIQSGVWKPGERLPSSRELKRMLGVSVRAPAEALQILAAEGLITLREKCGAVVSETQFPTVKGRILLIVPGGAQIRSAGVLMENVRRDLNAARYLVVTTSVLREKDFVEDDHDPYNLEQLEHELKMSYSLVVLYGAPPFTDGTVRLLAKARHPFLIVGGPRATACNCIGSIGYSMDRAIGEFTEHCRRTGVKRAVFVRKWRDDRSNVAAALRKAGIKVEMLSVPQRVERGRSEDLWRMAYASFERTLSEKGRKWLPDLIYFTDDHCFQGAVMSLLRRRISVPRDVCLVTETNAGIRPPFPVTIAGIEYDLKKSAKTISAVMLDYLDRGIKIPDDIVLDCEYVPGDTFT